MRDAPPVLSLTPLWRVTQAAFVLGLALSCGLFVESAARERQDARRFDLAPQAITPLSASPVGTSGPTWPLSRLAPGHACTSALTLEPKTGALIVLTLEAPCLADQRVEISHAGLRFAVPMPVGRPLRLTLPALEASGEVEILLQDGRKIAEAAPVPDMKDHRRFAVSWTGPQALDLVAWDGRVEVSLAEPRATLGTDAGWMAELGDAALPHPALAQVYTYPAEAQAEVTLRATSLPGLCGEKLIARTFSSRLGQAEATGLRVDLPECSAGPVVMHLKNLDQDVKVASR
ncbi:hypothetical protein [Stagnihabitans tardus]|uniref:Uncharacterized protein n=1 Tax=Stagnihabitans tardus TaxID=2699202 RepID=A0AAE4YAF5_9RHOB|nr:hypothetical protein [Stagnihabitans tardus]NBZ88067.1 hypothetical protein [Stagnihabitans tardus]